MQKEFVALGATSDFRGMATTLVGARIVESTVTVFNVGDSRAYLLINDETGPHVRLLSRDHSLLNDMIYDGEITQELSIGAASFLRGLTSHFIADPEFDDFQVNVVSHQWLPKLWYPETTLAPRVP